ncbi:hypothetical protein H0H93_014233 [Arthromyces matolae]|nr:hypothetical protein H0H93_014233 [Arthromyces matolae]
MSTSSDNSVTRFTEEELVQSLFHVPLTEEEYNAFLLSVSPHTTKFNIPFTDDTNFLAQKSLNDSYYNDLLKFVQSSQILGTDIIPAQRPLDTTSLALIGATPSQFIVECGMDPGEFKCLQKPLEENDMWESVLQEVLEKITEWAKTSDIPFTDMGFDTHAIFSA